MLFFIESLTENSASSQGIEVGSFPSHSVVSERLSLGIYDSFEPHDIYLDASKKKRDPPSLRPACF